MGRNPFLCPPRQRSCKGGRRRRPTQRPPRQRSCKGDKSPLVALLEGPAAEGADPLPSLSPRSRPKAGSAGPHRKKVGAFWTLEAPVGALGTTPTFLGGAESRPPEAKLLKGEGGTAGRLEATGAGPYGGFTAAPSAMAAPFPNPRRNPRRGPRKKGQRGPPSHHGVIGSGPGAAEENLVYPHRRRRKHALGRSLKAATPWPSGRAAPRENKVPPRGLSNPPVAPSIPAA